MADCQLYEMNQGAGENKEGEENEEEEGSDNEEEGSVLRALPIRTPCTKKH